MNLDIWSILIIVIAFQGLFLLTVLFSAKERKKKRSNQYLIFIIIILIWFLAEFFTIRNKINVNLNIFYGTRYGSWFLLGPITYFYFKSITDLTWKFSKQYWLHFLPFIIFVIIIPFVSYRTLNNSQVDYGMLSVFDHRERATNIIQYTYSIVFIIQFAHLGYFLIQNLKLINLYSKGLIAEYSTIDIKIKWLRNFNIVLIILLTLSAIFLYILLLTDVYRRHMDYIYVLPIGILFYFISFKFMRTDWKPIDKTINKYAGSTLNNEQIPKYVAQLDQLIESEKVYLNHNLRLNDLSERMNINKHHLSQILNQHYQLSFYDFINRFRIEEAKVIIQNTPEHTLVQIAYDAGFNNKTSFVNAFKKFENTTPSKFREVNQYS